MLRIIADPAFQTQGVRGMHVAHQTVQSSIAFGRPFRALSCQEANRPTQVGTRQARSIKQLHEDRSRARLQDGRPPGAVGRQGVNVRRGRVLEGHIVAQSLCLRDVGIHGRAQEALHVVGEATNDLSIVLCFPEAVGATQVHIKRMRVFDVDSTTDELPAAIHVDGRPRQLEVVHVHHQEQPELGVPIARRPFFRHRDKPTTHDLFLGCRNELAGLILRSS